MTGSQLDDSPQQCWDQRYRDSITEQSPALVLSAHTHLLPATGTALDLACGLGANALLLARHGLETWAWDISPVAIGRLDGYAAQAGLAIHTEVRDVVLKPSEPARFDVIIVSRFLERSLAPCLQAALRPGGLLFYQTFTKTRTSEAMGPRNPDFLLNDNELLRLFAPLRIRFYREEGLLGNITRGLRNEAMLIAQKVEAHESNRTA
ncbi:MAG: methyltransferase domain-containing protein [Candidatus Competibacteraceae bacterium]